MRIMDVFFHYISILIKKLYNILYIFPKSITIFLIFAKRYPPACGGGNVSFGFYGAKSATETLS